MNVLLMKYYFVTLYLLSNIANLSNCYPGKQSKYKKYVIEDNNLCSDIANREIKLKNDREEAVLVTQTTTKSHRIDWTTNFYCKFTVEANSALFAVVQNLNFRRNFTTGECIDYVKFQTRKPSYHQKLCGDFNVATDSDENLSFVAFDNYGFIETTIFISKAKLEQSMDVKIVYTKTKRCDANYSFCELRDTKLCINNEFFNDSFVNCPVDNCFDETSCEVLQNNLKFGLFCEGDKCENDISSQGDSGSTKIILSAVTSLVISFVLFIICVWICKKTRKLCFGANWSETAQPVQTSRVIEMQNRAENSVSAPQASVPTSPDPEKDLPPTYDSLFPER